VGELLLGSSSPRRQEILRYFSLPFRAVASGFDETQVPYEGRPAAYAEEVARRKAAALVLAHPEATILTADTVVALGSRLFLKPESHQEAKSMLSELSGKEHTVYTGVAVAQGEKLFSDVESTRVCFVELSPDEIDKYVNLLSPLDKSGGYAIQQGGGIIVKRIEGCYYNVMGLPLQTTRRLLGKAGIDLWDTIRPS
jgi:septum formation protein